MMRNPPVVKELMRLRHFINDAKGPIQSKGPTWVNVPDSRGRFYLKKGQMMKGKNNTH